MNKHGPDSGETRQFTPVRKNNENNKQNAGGTANGPQAQPARPQAQPARPQAQPARPQAQPARPQGQPARPQGQTPHPQGQAAHPQGQTAHPQGQTVRPQGQAPHPQGQTPHPQAQIRPQAQTVRPAAQLRPPVRHRQTPSSQEQTKMIAKVQPAEKTVYRNAGDGRIKPADRAVPPDRAGGTRLMNAASGGGSAGALLRSRNRNLSRRPPDRGSDGGEAVTGALTSVMKAIIYIVFVLVVSGFLSYFGISVCNDVFAFVKQDNQTEIIIPEFATLDDIAGILSENDIIEYPSIFKLYAKLRRDSGEYLAGTYTVTPAMNYDMLLADFKPKVKPREEVSVTIPEGYSIDQIIELFTSKDMGTREGFVEVIQNGDFSKYKFNWFIEDIEAFKSPDRKYRLEGYLFPDTYYFYSDSDEFTIVYKMLKNFYDKFDEAYKARCAELGYSVDQIITLASMVQAEAKFPSEYSSVSSVFHNRLDNPSGPTQGRLESDPTIQYMLEEHKEILDKADTERESPYNTYIIKGLPPGPICNPSLNAIQYTLYPAETDYLYFVAQRNGYHLFAVTYDEHIRNIIAARGG